jgi:hypothetical protein
VSAKAPLGMDCYDSLVFPPLNRPLYGLPAFRRLATLFDKQDDDRQ